MTRLFLLTLAALVLAGRPTPAGQDPLACPTTASGTAPESQFALPAPFENLPQEAGHFWHGTQALWTRLSRDGHWRGLYRADLRAHRNKVFVWRPGYDPRIEPRPALSVMARRLDGDSPAATFDRPTNARAEDIGTTMLTAVNLPAEGCWEVTLRYAADELTFVVVVP